MNTRSKITSLVCITALVISAVSLFMNYRTISGNTRAEITHLRSLIKKREGNPAKGSRRFCIRGSSSACWRVMLKEQSETSLKASECMVANLEEVNTAFEIIAQRGHSIAVYADGIKRLAGRLVKWPENFWKFQDMIKAIPFFLGIYGVLS